MAVFENMTGINVASGFKLQAKAPLDVREVVDTIADRDLLVTENGAYEGMKVYVKENKTTYELKGTTNSDWSAVGGDVAAALNTANTAKSTAEAAAEDAEEAATNASTALSTAGEAKTTAEGAASDAGTALSTANTAKTTADGAASAAATAQSTAEGAATAASTAQATADSKVKVIWVEQGGEAPGTAEANSLCFRIL